MGYLTFKLIINDYTNCYQLVYIGDVRGNGHHILLQKKST